MVVKSIKYSIDILSVNNILYNKDLLSFNIDN